MTKSQLHGRARGVRLLVLDVDGVLTDRRIVLSSNGAQTKAFDVQDGFGLVLARKAGLKIAIITAERSNVVTLRAQQLKVDWIAQFARDKRKVFSRCLKHFKISPESVGYMGDDLLDLPVLTKVGFSAAPADARPEVKRQVHYVASLGGGRGAVREIVELILHAQGHWSRIVEEYLEPVAKPPVAALGGFASPRCVAFAKGSETTPPSGCVARRRRCAPPATPPPRALRSWQLHPARPREVVKGALR